MTGTAIRYGAVVVAYIDERNVFLLPPIGPLENDHPRRRFVCMMALVGREMQLEPDAEPYDDALAEFYARVVLMPDEQFLQLDDGRADSELAERFNVPLEQIAAKRYDLAFLRPARGGGRAAS